MRLSTILDTGTVKYLFSISIVCDQNIAIQLIKFFKNLKYPKNCSVYN